MENQLKMLLSKGKTNVFHAHCQPSSQSNRFYHNNLFSSQGILTQYAKDDPMFNQIQKYSNLSENALNLFPQTSSQASDGGRATESAEENSQR